MNKLTENGVLVNEVRGASRPEGTGTVLFPMLLIVGIFPFFPILRGSGFNF